MLSLKEKILICLCFNVKQPDLNNFLIYSFVLMYSAQSIVYFAHFCLIGLRLNSKAAFDILAAQLDYHLFQYQETEVYSIAM